VHISDYSKGFGGRYGLQTDRQDKSAVGWDYRVQLEKHESQIGNGRKLPKFLMLLWYLSLLATVLLHVALNVKHL
jgi:hypothetical protein